MALDFFSLGPVHGPHIPSLESCFSFALHSSRWWSERNRHSYMGGKAKQASSPLQGYSGSYPNVPQFTVNNQVRTLPILEKNRGKKDFSPGFIS